MLAAKGGGCPKGWSAEWWFNGSVARWLSGAVLSGAEQRP